MRKARKTVFATLLLACVTFWALHVAAADELLGTVVDGSVLTDKLEVEDTVYPWLRGSYLSSGSGSLTIAGTGSVTVSGNTSTYQTVDEIKVTLRLQRLESGTWVEVAKLGPKVKYNSSYVSNSKTYSVARGYYYRVTGSHTAIEGGTPESISSATDGIWVP